ncbi:MAG: hypothetical protein V3V06_05815 [Dehalococcoidia bacterium]
MLGLLLLPLSLALTGLKLLITLLTDALPTLVRLAGAVVGLPVRLVRSFVGGAKGK